MYHVAILHFIYSHWTESYIELDIMCDSLSLSTLSCVFCVYKYYYFMVVNYQVDSVLLLLHHADVGEVAQISNIHADSIFRVKVCRLMSFCVYIALCFEKEGGTGRPYWPPLYLPTLLTNQHTL